MDGTEGGVLFLTLHCERYFPHSSSASEIIIGFCKIKTVRLGEKYEKGTSA
jgi:hypothetical protein